MNWVDNLKEKLKKYKKNIALVFMAVLMLVTFKTCNFNSDDDKNNDKDPDIDYEQFINDMPDIDDDFINSLNLLDYDGDSLEEALKEGGYPYTYPYRLGIANYFGIDDYIGTPDQDKTLIDLINENYIIHHPKIDLPTPEIPTKDPIMDNDPSKEDVNKPVKPTPTPDQKPENNKPVDKHDFHRFGDWVSINDDLEQRTCPCGAKETRAHKYTAKTTTVQNKNGTHTIVVTSTCVNCGHKKTISETKKCNYSEWTYDAASGLEKRECSLCHYVETRAHNHDYNKIVKCDSEYEYKSCICGQEIKVAHNFDKGTLNADGSTTYKCLNCGYEKTIEKNQEETHHHSYKIYDWDETYEYKKCSCGKTTKVKHELDNGTLNADGSVTYKCKHDDCGFTKTIRKEDPHVHSFKLVSWDANGETYKCSCGEVKTDSHALGGKVTKDDGTIVRACTHEGCGYEEVHIHVTSEDIVPIKSSSVCYEIVVSCEECGKLYSTEVDHDWVLIDEGRQTYIYGCTVCGKEKEVDKPKKEEEPSVPSTPVIDPEPIPEPQPTSKEMEQENAYILVRKRDE